MLSEFTYKTLRFPFSAKKKKTGIIFEKHKLNKKIRKEKIIKK